MIKNNKIKIYDFTTNNSIKLKQPKPIPKSKLIPKLINISKSKPKSKAKPKPNTIAKAKPKPKTIAKAKPESKIILKAKPKSKKKPKTKPKTKPKIKPKTKKINELVKPKIINELIKPKIINELIKPKIINELVKPKIINELIKPNLSYYISKNFGDAVSPILYNFLSEKKITKVGIKSNKISYLTVGSILKLATDKHIVMGSGFIAADNKLNIKPRNILSVRGPKTREKLLNMNIECPENYGDPLIIFPLVYNKKQIKEYTIGLIPHYVDKIHINILVNKLKKKGYKVNIINILTGLNYKPFIDAINKCEYIISSSLHGVIMGLVYGKKTIFTKFSNNVVGGFFKFEDFFLSLGIKYNVINFNDKNLLKNIINIDYNNLINIGKDIINVCPLIENVRKTKLINLWKSHVNKINNSST